MCSCGGEGHEGGQSWLLGRVKGPIQGTSVPHCRQLSQEKSVSKGFGSKRTGLGRTLQVLIPALLLTNFGTISWSPVSSHLPNADKNICLEFQ